MTRQEIIKELERVKDLLVEEVETDELTDYARDKAYIHLASAIMFIEENYNMED